MARRIAKTKEQKEQENILNASNNPDSIIDTALKAMARSVANLSAKTARGESLEPHEFKILEGALKSITSYKAQQVNEAKSIDYSDMSEEELMNQISKIKKKLKLEVKE